MCNTIVIMCVSGRKTKKNDFFVQRLLPRTVTRTNRLTIGIRGPAYGSQHSLLCGVLNSKQRTQKAAFKGLLLLDKTCSGHSDDWLELIIATHDGSLWKTARSFYISWSIIRNSHKFGFFWRFPIRQNLVAKNCLWPIKSKFNCQFVITHQFSLKILVVMAPTWQLKIKSIYRMAQRQGP